MTQRRGRRTVAVWIVLVALLVLVTLLELADRSTQRSEDVSGEPTMLMPAPIEEIAAIEIAVDGDLHRFARDDQGAWFYHGVHAGPQSEHEHLTDPAMAQKIAKSLSGLGRARIERRFELQGEGRYGVTRPEMIILVFLPNQSEPRVQYAVGDLAPDDLSRYVHIVGTQEIVMIPDYQIRNLLDLISAVTAAPSTQIGSPS